MEEDLERRTERNFSVDSQRTDISRFSLDGIMEMLPKLQTTKEVWRRPALHRDRVIPSVDFKSYFNSHRSETWYELFYDLVFVAASIQIGTIIKYNISGLGLLKAGILFTVFRATWDQVMFYQNKFDTKDLVHYIYYLVQAMLVFVMALHLTLDDDHQWDIERNMAAVSVSAGVSRLYAVAMYIQVMMITRNYRQHIIHVAVAQFLSGFLFFLAPYLMKGEKFYWFWLGSIAIERVIVHIRIALAIPLKDRAPPHFGHLSHRQGTFILLVSGEAIIQLVQSSCGNSISDFARGLMGFAIIFNVGDIYYQQQIVGRLIFCGTHAQPPTTIWTFLHLTLSIAMLYFAVSIKMVYSQECDKGHGSNRAIEDEFFMCISASVSLIIIFILRMTHKGIWYKGKQVRVYSYLFRFFIAFCCAFIPYLTHKPLGTIAILFALTSVLILQDLFSHRGLRDRIPSNHKDDDIPPDLAVDPAYDQGTLTSERLARLGMVVPETSGNSSFFYTTDESFGRDEYLKKSALASSQQYDFNGITSASALASGVGTGGRRSQSTDSSRNSRTISNERERQRRRHPSSSSFSSRGEGLQQQQQQQQTQQPQPRQSHSTDLTHTSAIAPLSPLSSSFAAPAAAVPVSIGKVSKETKEEETRSALHQNLQEPLLPNFKSNEENSPTAATSP